MVVFRANDIHVLRYIYPKMVVDSGVNADHVAEYLYYFLDKRPDDICISVAFDGDELKGFLIGIREPFRDFIWVEQCWIDKDVSKDVSTKLYELLEDWVVQDCGMKEIRFQTERKPELFERSWGFTVKGYVMSKILETENE